MNDDEVFGPAGAPLPLRISLADWEALPLSTRVGERLVDVLILATELRADLENEQAAELAWIVPTVDSVLAEADALLKRLAS